MTKIPEIIELPERTIEDILKTIDAHIEYCEATKKFHDLADWKEVRDELSIHDK